ncbi:hypothetical protein [Tenacibaculum finnmarkense]|uniref:hypothetical protein n=1 Tax=Tenacibaculum finnmarkense TaxID=2781243 RepID=UPI00187B86BC|nr:hypothetical protein [Tenacibaculum finnmarkense]MBE7649150.1 hypothetical protein [Tenacibaculum finnmarkense genomovar ulcerans]
MNKNLIVQLEDGVYLADWIGDPGRTLKIENAKVFKNQDQATNALKEARKFRPFVNAGIFNLKKIKNK